MALAALACAEPDADAGDARATAAPEPATVETAWATLAGQRLELELALDPSTRQRGLSGRDSIPRNGGMLFVFPDSAPRAMVMRDCLVPIDVAFLDPSGRVVAVHAMPVEPPRGPEESRFFYERRLPTYPSRLPAQFAIETAGGRLAELGVSVGDRVQLDARALAGRAR